MQTCVEFGRLRTHVLKMVFNPTCLPVLECEEAFSEHVQAFRRVIIPVMWPGVITTGLFSFLLAYNDFAVTALLLSKENQTMVPKIASFLGTTQTEGNVMFAVAAVVSATAPLFILVMFFQRQIVSGLTAGAVKG